MNVRPSGRPEGEYSIAEEGREARRVLWSTTVWTKRACGKGRRRAASSWGLTRRPVDLEPLVALPCGPGRADETDACSIGQAEETPPHEWGRLLSISSFPLVLGNTPTCVGKTREARLRDTSIWKHPHMRGEDCLLRAASAIARETPPHAWGRQESFQAIRYGIRNTPTCVGKTENVKRIHAKKQKHPHMRGEDTDILLTFSVRVK